MVKVKKGDLVYTRLTDSPIYGECNPMKFARKGEIMNTLRTGAVVKLTTDGTVVRVPFKAIVGKIEKIHYSLDDLASKFNG